MAVMRAIAKVAVTPMTGVTAKTICFTTTSKTTLFTGQHKSVEANQNRSFKTKSTTGTANTNKTNHNVNLKSLGIHFHRLNSEQIVMFQSRVFIKHFSKVNKS